MALEDFVSEEDEKRVDFRSVQYPIDFSDPENEDLFDFEDMTILSKGSADLPTPAAAAPAARVEAEPEVAVLAEAPEPQPDLTPKAAPAPDPVTAAPVAAAPVAAAPVAAAPVAAAPVAAAPVAANAEGDLLDEIEPQPNADVATDPLTAAPGEPVGTAPPAADLAPARTPHGRLVFTEDELPTLVVPSGQDGERTGHGLPALLIAGFAVINVSLLFFAWRASRSFETTMESITETVSDAVLESSTRAGLASARIDPEPQTELERDPIEDLEPILIPSAVENYHEWSLKIARDHLDEGAFSEARLTLNHMLANKARADVPPQLQARAEFLIAESYHREAIAISEGTEASR
ncbi:MAG: hypothetical protein GY711_04465 [bacterium]|nr:hypothetical protein [bacterium]